MGSISRNPERVALSLLQQLRKPFLPINVSQLEIFLLHIEERGYGSNMGNIDDWLLKFVYWKPHPRGVCIGRWLFREVTKRSWWVEWLAVKVSFLLTTPHNQERPEKILSWGTAEMGLISGKVFAGLSWLLFEAGKPTWMPGASSHHMLDPELCSSKESRLSRNSWEASTCSFYAFLSWLRMWSN